MHIHLPWSTRAHCYNEGGDSWKSIEPVLPDEVRGSPMISRVGPTDEYVVSLLYGLSKMVCIKFVNPSIFILYCFRISFHSCVHRGLLWSGWLGGLDQVQRRSWHPDCGRRPDRHQPQNHPEGYRRQGLQLPAAQGQPDRLRHRVHQGVSFPLCHSICHLF